MPFTTTLTANLRNGITALFTGTALAVLLSMATVSASDNDKALKALEGEWKVKSIIHDGEDGKINDPVTSTWTIKDNKITYGPGYRGYEVFQLDPTKSPKTLDGKTFRENQEETTFKAIYKIEGHTLTLCFYIKGKNYPTAFESKVGSGLRLITLTRAKE
jgi:uncharacterized protein (TIGR03067 family)